MGTDLELRSDEQQPIDLLDVLFVDPSSVSDTALADRVLMAEAVIRRAEAVLVAHVAEADRRQVWAADGYRGVRAWLTAQTNGPDHDAITRTRVARLERDLPQVAAVFHGGLVGVAQVRELARVYANPRCGHRLADAVDVLLHHARTLPYPDFVRVLRRWEQLADADGAHQRADDAHAGRAATVATVGDEFHLVAHGGTAQGSLIHAVFEAYLEAEFQRDWQICRARYGDDAAPDLCPRTPAQRSFDALHAVFSVASGTAADRAPVPVVNVIVDQATFETAMVAKATGRAMAELTEDLPGHALLGRCCETNDGAPIDPLDAADAALIGHVRRVVMDGAGVTINLGRRRRLFQGSARVAALLGRHRCLWPGCTQRARQVDHTQPYGQQGDTDQDNSGPLCGWHNRWRTRGFTPDRQPDGTWVIRRPDGTAVSTDWHR